MNEYEIHTKLTELMQQISTLPASERAKRERLASETLQRQERLQKNIAALQESVDYLRISIKYLVFDLEATRRENRHLRQMLKEATED